MDGDGGLRTLRDEPEAENEEVRIPSNIRWLGGRKDIRSRRLVKEIEEGFEPVSEEME